MAGLIDKRKRSREEDVFCDSTPLSKRINNLHLSNNEMSSTSRSAERHHYQNHYEQEHQQHQQGINCDEPMNPHLNHASGAAALNPPDGYNPELNESDNPYYYSKNRLLHELHLERMKRCPH